ncbi:MAG: CDP-diacylglycerol--glycerol-3-phosphate 3-phosphatidyltransferase [Deltaproteobacteria bacterium]|nr:CDP-diacylglycerol--glycerol-3-phosphate 3-phosphatidyltransferase [Deltaproteobacteria bacterium]RLA91709.1 MAG: CDP-diacylglycerol--glycerol-3-phosphate 3-phosphatidyltransferase [Deltaproteobacteria bacterium]
MLNIPNSLTVIRILLIPLFINCLIYQNFLCAFWVFIIAGITDALDGLIARLARQKTLIGAFLDPIADKLLISSGFITLAIMHKIPKWLVVIVISRDVIICLGVLVLFLINKKPEMKPTWISKLTTTFQFITIIMVLFIESTGKSSHKLRSLYTSTAVFTILSGFHYLYKGTKLLNNSQKL